MHEGHGVDSDGAAAIGTATARARRASGSEREKKTDLRHLRLDRAAHSTRDGNQCHTLTAEQAAAQKKSVYRPTQHP